MTLLAVVGMNTEARIVGRRARVAIGVPQIDAALEARPAGVISFGLCGGLDPAFAVGDIIVARGVAGPDGFLATDPAWSAMLAKALPGSKIGVMAASREISGTAAGKARLRALTKANAVDLESDGAARAAVRAGLPFVILRVISDGALDSLPMAAQVGFQADGGIDLAAILMALIRRPRDLGPLIKTARDAAKAFKTLERCADVLTLPPPAA
jgi:nucleoside phosphorylase